MKPVEQSPVPKKPSSQEEETIKAEAEDSEAEDSEEASEEEDHMEVLVEEDSETVTEASTENRRRTEQPESRMSTSTTILEPSGK